LVNLPLYELDYLHGVIQHPEAPGNLTLSYITAKLIRRVVTKLALPIVITKHWSLNLLNLELIAIKNLSAIRRSLKHSNIIQEIKAYP